MISPDYRHLTLPTTDNDDWLDFDHEKGVGNLLIATKRIHSAVRVWQIVDADHIVLSSMVR